MAIFNPANQASQGANAMFNNINQAMQRLQEQKQMQRNDEFESKLKGQGLLGIASEDVIDPTTGKVNLEIKDKEGKVINPKSVNAHFNALGGSDKMKDLRKVFGPTATSDDVKAYITQQARSRDQKISEAIVRRMEELGLDVENPSSGDIWKVVDKGDEAFKNWYNATDEMTRKQLRALGYHPDMKEVLGLPTFMEKRIAQKKGAISGTALLGGVGAVGAGAYFGRNKITNLAKSYKGKGVKQLQYGLGQMARDIDAGKLSGQEAQRIVTEMKKGAPKEVKSILNKIPKSLKNPKQLVRALGKQAPILGAFSPGQIVGEEIAEGVGLGETGQALGGLAGGTATATAIARALPALIRGAGKVVPHPVAKGALTALGVGSGALLDHLLND